MMKVQKSYLLNFPHILCLHEADELAYTSPLEEKMKSISVFEVQETPNTALPSYHFNL